MWWGNSTRNGALAWRADVGQNLRCGVASGIGALPLTIAFAPERPHRVVIEINTVQSDLVTVVLALVAGSVFHGLWLVLRALVNAEL